MRPRRSAALHRQTGFGLVEIMVGLVIGLIAVLVIYQIYTVAEGFKRNTTATGEAQMNGLFSTFTLGMELANGGSGMAVSAADLASCPDTGNIATSFRPIPVLITDGGGDSNPDSFVVNYSIASTLSTTAMFNVQADSGDAQFHIQSPEGFHAGDLIVGVANPGGDPKDAASKCASAKIAANGVSAPAVLASQIDFFGANTDVADVTITHSGMNVDFTGICTKGQVGTGPCPYKPPSVLFNLGPANRAQKVLYRLCDGRNGCPQPPVCDQLAAGKASCTLESVPLLDANGQPLANPVGNPLASNVINMKVEYGVDADLDPKGVVDTWTQATAAAGWDAGALLPAPISKINQIKAVRIGIIVQSEQFDKDLAGFTGGDYVAGDYSWTLFGCAKAPCQGALAGTVAASTSPAGNWRFRKYETVIPLRNEIWNKAS